MKNNNHQFKVVYNLDEFFPSDGDNGYELDDNGEVLNIKMKYFAGEDTEETESKLIRFHKVSYFYQDLMFKSFLHRFIPNEPLYDNLLVEYKPSTLLSDIQSSLENFEGRHFYFILISSEVIFNVVASHVELLDVE